MICEVEKGPRAEEQFDIGAVEYQIYRIWDVRILVWNITKHVGGFHQKELDQLLQSSWSWTVTGSVTGTHMATLHFAPGNYLQKNAHVFSTAKFIYNQ